MHTSLSATSIAIAGSPKPVQVPLTKLLKYAILPAVVITAALSASQTKTTFASGPSKIKTWVTFEQDAISTLGGIEDDSLYEPPQFVQGVTNQTAVINEEGIREYLNTSIFAILRNIFSKLMPGCNICRPGKLQAPFIGQPDFVSVQTDEAISFPIEVKTPVSLPFEARQDLVDLYSVGQQSPVNSAVDQIYGYMAGNSLQYGVLTNGYGIWFMCQTNGCLQVSRSIDIASPRSSQMSALEGMFCLHLLASEKQASTPIASRSGRSIFNRFGNVSFSWMEVGLALLGCHLFGKIQRLLSSTGSIKHEGVYTVEQLHLERYLAQGRNTHVCMGNKDGHVAAVKLVNLFQCPEIKLALQHEVDMYKQMTTIQGVHVPHLLAYGFIQRTGSYFIATSFEGFALREDSMNATMLKQLQASLSAVHRCGILHNDLAVRNVCVSANGHVRVLDFGNVSICRDAAMLSQEVESTLSLVSDDRSLRTSKACLQCSTGRASQVCRKSFRFQCRREAPLCLRSRPPYGLVGFSL